MMSSIVRTRKATAMGLSICAISLLTLLCFLPSLQAQQKRRLAVMSFEVGADARLKASIQFGINDDLGRRLSDLLIDKLVADGKFTLVERTELDKILKEQNFSNSDRTDSSTAARIGKIAGVQAIVIGTVTQFGADKKSTKLGGVLSHFNPKGFGVDQSTTTVTVATTARVVDTNTGEILASATGTGDSVKSSTTVTTAATSSNAMYDTKSKDFGTTMIGEATLKAIYSMAAQIEATAPALAPAPPPPPAPVLTSANYSGVIADISGKTIIITAGSKSGVKVGDTLLISRPIRKVTNPQTGEVIKVISDKLGEAIVTEVDAGSATATYKGASVIRVKDEIKRSGP